MLQGTVRIDGACARLNTPGVAQHLTAVRQADRFLARADEAHLLAGGDSGLGDGTTEIDAPERDLARLGRAQDRLVVRSPAGLVLPWGHPMRDQHPRRRDGGEQLHILAVPGQRHIGQMPVETLGAKHEGPVYGRALRLVDGDGIAVIEGGIAGRIDLHLATATGTLGTVDPDQNAPRFNLRDCGQHPVAHTKVAVVLAEEQPVAGCKTAPPFGRVIVQTGEDITTRDAGSTDGSIDATNGGALMGKPETGAVRMQVHIGEKRGNKRLEGILGGGGKMDMPTRGIGGETVGTAPLPQIDGGAAHPVTALTAHPGQLHRPGTLDHGTERRAGPDGLQLLGIAHQHDLGPGLLDARQHAAKLQGAKHPGLVENKDLIGAGQIALQRPGPLPGRDGAARNTGALLQPLGGLARKRRSDDLIARCFPGGSGRIEHGALAGARKPDHGGQTPRRRDMTHRRDLLDRQMRGTAKGGNERPLAHPVTARTRERQSRPRQIPLGGK